VHTIVFDKTGTLTSGNSEVVSPPDTFTPGQWQRIYLLEAAHGEQHPLAQAICAYYDKHFQPAVLIRETEAVMRDIQHRGLKGRVQGVDLCIGSYAYLKALCIQQLPAMESIPEPIQQGIKRGYTPIYVAENGTYQGVLFVKHMVDPHILGALKRLKEKKRGSNAIPFRISGEMFGGFLKPWLWDNSAVKPQKDAITLVMLTGDTEHAAQCFNQQCGGIFDAIHAGKNPDEKENIVKALMGHNKQPPEREGDPKGVWFVGDGLNDAPCAREVNEKGGVSFAMRATDKAAFFTDISLNGSLEYLFQWRGLNQCLKHNTWQNQGLLVYGLLVFLVLLICFPLAGVAMVPIIPLLVMVSTTLMTLFNAYRLRVAVDVALDGSPSFIQRCFASDISLILLVTGCTLLVCSLLLMTFATGHLALPALVFTAGTSIALSSGFLLASLVLLGGFTTLSIAYMLTTRSVAEVSNDVTHKATSTPTEKCVLKSDSEQPVTSLVKPLFAPASKSDISIFSNNALKI
jgi:Cu+-exporting ATPase